jgi:nitrate reductase gamma subunit
MMRAYLNFLVFGIYPYVCLSVFLIGSLVRFDREPYSWRSGSSQLLRTGLLRWGSNLLHAGVLVLFVGHLVGMLTPHVLYEPLMSSGAKQVVAMVVGGVAGVLALIGLSLLLYRRHSDPRIRATSTAMDIAILWILWLQLVLGLGTIPFSAQHRDGSTMVMLAEWAQRIVTFRGGAAELMLDMPWVFKAHMALGLTVFLLFPFSRLVHIWSAPIGYVIRPYQLVRRRSVS